MTRVLVLAGGLSAEREVSQRSGQAVVRALQIAGYTVAACDPAQQLPVWDCNAVFVALHGVGGEDGSIQATLDTIGIPYVGSGSKASEICYDKWLYRQTIHSQLQMPDGDLVTLHRELKLNFFEIHITI